MVYNGVFHGIFTNNGYILIRLTTYKLHCITNFWGKWQNGHVYYCIVLFSTFILYWPTGDTVAYTYISINCTHYTVHYLCTSYHSRTKASPCHTAHLGTVEVRHRIWGMDELRHLKRGRRAGSCWRKKRPVFSEWPLKVKDVNVGKAIVSISDYWWLLVTINEGCDMDLL
jgi:hypothetical protein